MGKGDERMNNNVVPEVQCSVCHRPHTTENHDIFCKYLQSQNPPELVDHPAHYGGEDNPYEHVKVAEALGWNFNAFIYNCTRYLWRVGKKDGNPTLQDLKKARWYLDREIQRLEKHP